MALLTIVQQQAIKPISGNWAASIKITGGVNNFTQLQIEVEEKELKKLLGLAFLQAIQANPTDANYVKLLDGTTFEDCEGNNVSFKGLRYVLSYMNYSKYVSESHFGDTYSGMVQKTRNETTPLNSGDIKRTQLDSQEIALSDFEIIKDYLNENTSTFPLWNSIKSKKPYTPRFIGVKRTKL